MLDEREELDAHVSARRELGPEYEPELVDSFLERIEGKLDQGHHGKAARAAQECGVPASRIHSERFSW